MKRFPSFIFCALAILSAASFFAPLSSAEPATPAAHETPLRNADVVKMLHDGLSPDVVAAKVRKSESEFDTSPGTLAALKAAGVPDAVTLAMLEAPAAHAAENRPPDFTWFALVPLFQTLVWPLLLLIVLIAWRGQVTRLLKAVIKRVEEGAEVEFGGVVHLHAAPPYER